MTCKHENTQYCRVQTANGHQFFALQCTDCKQLVKSPKHQNKLFLKPTDIPPAETIHAFQQSEGGKHD